MSQTTLIVNPASNSGRTASRWEGVAEMLEAAGHIVTAQLTREPGDGAPLAEEAARAGADRVVAMGGDGTAQEVVNGLLRVEGRPPLGLIQAGTGNALRTVFGIPADLGEQAGIVANGRVEAYDVGWADFFVDGEPVRQAFMLEGGVGLSSSMLERTLKWKPRVGVGAYGVALVEEALDTGGFDAEIVIDGSRRRGKTVEVLAFNLPMHMGPLRMAPGGDGQDGQLDFMAVADRGRWHLLNTVARVPLNRHATYRGVKYAQVRELRVIPDTPQRVQLDGEIVGDAPVTFTIAAGGIEVLVPGSAG